MIAKKTSLAEDVPHSVEAVAVVATESTAETAKVAVEEEDSAVVAESKNLFYFWFCSLFGIWSCRLLLFDSMHSGTHFWEPLTVWLVDL